MMQLFYRTRWLAALLLVVIWAALAAGSWLFSRKPPSCFEIRSAPYAIEAPGCYRVIGDLKLADPNGTAILVRVSHVRLDLGGFRVETQRDEMAAGTGISVVSASDVVVENGTLRNFMYGVRVDPLPGRPADNVTIRALTVEHSLFRGIVVRGNRNTVAQNTVIHTGGTRFFRTAAVAGIEMAGHAGRITGNRVEGLVGVGGVAPVAIDVRHMLADGQIEGNRLSAAMQTDSHQGPSMQIAGPAIVRGYMSGQHGAIVNNQIFGFAKVESVLCDTIERLPAVLDMQGCYKLVQDLSWDGGSSAAITVRSDNVLLDLGGHTLEGQLQNGDRNVGILLMGVHGVTAENGTIRGFGYGITAPELPHSVRSTHVTLRKLVVDRSVFTGIDLDADESSILDVAVTRTGDPNAGREVVVSGIYLGGRGSQVSQSSVRDTFGVGRAQISAIALRASCDGCRIAQNTLSNAATGGAGATAFHYDSSRVHVVQDDNRISGLDTGGQEGR